MFVVTDNILINPIQILSVQYVESRLILNENRSNAKINIVMANGDKYEINSENCKDVDRAMQELVFQIDLASGMKFKPAVEGVPEETPKDVTPS